MFSSLMLNKDLNTREVGFAMAIGILIASLIVSTVLVSAVTTIVGEKVWWPSLRTVRPERHGAPADDPLGTEA